MKQQALAIHLCKKFFPIRGGIEVVIDRICRETKARGIDNSICTCDSDNSSVQPYKWAKVERVKSWGDVFSHPVAPGIFWKVLGALRSQGIAIVHYPFPAIDFSIALLAPFKRSKLIIYWHSNIYSQRVLKYAVAPFTYVMLWLSDEIIVATPRAILFSKMLKRFERKVKVIPYGLEDIDTVVKSRSGDYFVAVGRHVEYKGFDVLLNAMKGTEFKLVLIGDGALFEKHTALARQLGVGSQVSFVRTATDHERDEWIANSRCLVLPSIYPSEAFALVQLEAMRFSKPIINTGLDSGVPWVARNDVEAITVDAGSASQLRQAMTKITDDPLFSDRLGSGGRERFVSLFTSKRYANSLLELLF